MSRPAWEGLCLTTTNNYWTWFYSTLSTLALLITCLVLSVLLRVSLDSNENNLSLPSPLAKSARSLFHSAEMANLTGSSILELRLILQSIPPQMHNQTLFRVRPDTFLPCHVRFRRESLRCTYHWHHIAKLPLRLNPRWPGPLMTASDTTIDVIRFDCLSWAFRFRLQVAQGCPNPLFVGQARSSAQLLRSNRVSKMARGQSHPANCLDILHG